MDAPIPDDLMSDYDGPPNEDYFEERARRATPADGSAPVDLDQPTHPPEPLGSASALGPDVVGPDAEWGGFETVETPAQSGRFPEPIDCGTATLSPLGEVEYVSDLIRPGRIHLLAAEENTGKTSLGKELTIRFAVAGGAVAGTWAVTESGNVLYLSEMHPDDDLLYERQVLDSLGLDRSALAGRYFRLDLNEAAHGKPALLDDGWRLHIQDWVRINDIRLAIFDTATAATQVDPWGAGIHEVYRHLRLMLAEAPSLAIILAVHVKKPTGTARKRHIRDVLGEWGRWCDVVILMEDVGKDQTRVSTHKRLRHQKVITATRSGGLLIDPHEGSSGTRTSSGPPGDFVDIITANPGLGYKDLGHLVSKSKDTAQRWVEDLGSAVYVDKTALKHLVYPATAAPPQTAAHEDAAPHAVVGEQDRRSAAPPYKGAAAAAAPNSATNASEGADLAVEDDYPASAWSEDD